MIARLPWYESPASRAAEDLLWQAVRRQLLRRRDVAAPPGLARCEPCRQQWRRRDLLLSQACGYDVAHSEYLAVVATPQFALPGCRGGRYWSRIVVPGTSPAERLEDLRGARCIVNSLRSHSGAWALGHCVAPLARRGRFFGSVVVSGAHRESLAMLRAGEGDVAAIDCVLWALAASESDAPCAGLRTIGRTAAVPAPPFVTSAANVELADDLYAALRAAVAEHAASAARELLIDGVTRLGEDAYGVFRRPPQRIDGWAFTDFEGIV